MKRAFTLIELLVVISIISLLASVVLASLNTAREKGRIGAARYFSAQIDHLVGDQGVLLLDFDECAGSVANDSSGFRNNASLIAVSTSTWSSDTPAGTGCSISMTNGQGVSVPDADMLDIGTGSVTRSMWIKTTQTGPAFFRKSDSSNNRGMIMYLNTSPTGQLVCYVHDSPQITVYSSVSGLNDNKWHNVVCVMDRSTNLLSVYVDGTFQGKSDASALSAVDLNSSSVVYFPSGYLDYVGKIDGAHFYTKALTASDIGELYAEGLGGRSFASKQQAE